MYSLGDKFFYKQFNIPIYQRLYVWKDEQVNTLIEDLIKAYLHDPKHIYYLGGIVVVENQGKYDLIDGQQRFTTLKILRDILRDKNLTLDFSIRGDVWEDFNQDKDTENVDIRRMQNAQKLLQIGLDKIYEGKGIDRVLFLNYIKNQVKLVVTEVPSNTDLNKLFELINGRGEQLQQHQILKAKILSKIKDNSDKSKYGKVWDICADMDELFEISIKKSLLKKNPKKESELIAITWKDYFDDFKDLEFNCVLDKLPKNLENRVDKIGRPILDILGNSEFGEENDRNDTDPEDESSAQYFSIISFELFLLYLLVSFKDIDYFAKMKDKKIEFKDKNLIKIFETVLLDILDNEKAKNFIKYLFEFRRKYDKWVIRNYKDIGDKSNDTDHQLIHIKQILNGNTISRQIEPMKDSRNLELLQSMLYHAHTRNTQEWIIPFLSSIEDDLNGNLTLLKNIDNHLYSRINVMGTVLQRASSFNKRTEFNNCFEIIDYLKKTPKNYHDFSHYWFYKVDWIIWDLMSDDEKKNDKEFNFTARNSIEHISPQNPKDENIDRDKVLDNNSFGNLALISVAHNSSFSNNGFRTKMGYFSDKKIRNMKMSLIKDNIAWGDSKCKEHLADCIDKIKRYYI